MRHKILTILEILFFISFWFQTRINLRLWWPDYFSAPLNSDYLIPFVYLSDILLILLLIVWVVDKGFNQKLSNFQRLKPIMLIKKVWSWFGLFLGVSLISTIANGGEWWMWYGWLRLVEGVMLAMYIANRWQYTSIRKRAVYILSIGLFVESLLLIGEWIAQRSLGLQWIGEWAFNIYTPGIAKIIFNGQEFLRSYATFAHPNIAAAAILVGLITLMWWYLERLKREDLVIKFYIPKLIGGIAQQQNIHTTTVFTIVGALFSLSLFFTFSRSVWLVGAVCTTLLVVLSANYLKKINVSSHNLRWISVAILIIFLLISPLVWSRFSSLDGTDRLSVDRRLQLNQVAMDAIQSQPWAGVGVNNFITHVANYGPLYGIGIWREPVHNLYVLIMVETGVMGLITWLTAHTYIWINLARQSLKQDKRSEVNLLVIIWLGLILLGLIDHYWWTSQQGRLIWWVVVGVSIVAINSPDKIKNKTNT